MNAEFRRAGLAPRVARWCTLRINHETATSSLVCFSADLLDEEPIDGLDILSIEPQLIARTLDGGFRGHQ